MAEKRTWLSGHSYWGPGERWKHEGCVSSVVPSRATSPAKAVSNRQPQALRGVSNTLTNDVSNSAAERVRRWRAIGTHRAAYNAYQRLYMQAQRAIAAGRALRWPRAA